MNTASELTETSPEIVRAVNGALGHPLSASPHHTGGGVMVLSVVHAESPGREIWLSRDEQWVVGFYDFFADPEDEGTCVHLIPRGDDDAEAVAAEVAALARRWLLV